VSGHTKEPWHTGKGMLQLNIYDVDSHGVATALQHRIEAEANARRIVACVNACAGISNEQLEDGKLDVFLQALHIRELEAQNKELREAATAYKNRVIVTENAHEIDELTARLNKAITGGG